MEKAKIIQGPTPETLERINASKTRKNTTNNIKDNLARKMENPTPERIEMAKKWQEKEKKREKQLHQIQLAKQLLNATTTEIYKEILNNFLNYDLLTIDDILQVINKNPDIVEIDSFSATIAHLLDKDIKLNKEKKSFKQPRFFSNIPSGVLQNKDNIDIPSGVGGTDFEKEKDEARTLFLSGQPDYLFSIPVTHHKDYQLFFLTNCAVLESAKVGNAAFVLHYKMDNKLREEFLSKDTSLQTKELLVKENRDEFDGIYGEFTKTELAIIGDRIEHRGKENGMAQWMKKMYTTLNTYAPYGHLRYKFLDNLPQRQKTSTNID